MAGNWDDDDFDVLADVEEAALESVKEEKKPQEKPQQEKTTVTATRKSKLKEICRAKDNAVQEDTRGFGNQMLSEAQRQKIVEESDLNQARELFGKAGKASELDTFIPKTEADFIQYARMLSEKALFFQKEPHFAVMIKELVTQCCIPLNSGEIKAVNLSVTAAYNETLKKEKDTKGKKKTTSARPVLAKDIPPEADDYDAEYDDFM